MGHHILGEWRRVMMLCTFLMVEKRLKEGNTEGHVLPGMLEMKRKERDRTVLGQGYCLGTWDIWVQLKSTWKSWSYGNDLWSLHHGISLQGCMGQKARILDTCYHVLPHTLYPILPVFLILGIKPRFRCFFHPLPWGQGNTLLHLLNSSLCANHIYMTANLYNSPVSIYSVVQLARKGSPSGPSQRAQ